MNYAATEDSSRAQVDREDDVDLVWGAAEIGKVIGRSSRQANHLLASGKLPAKKIGSAWVARRSTLKSIVP